MSNSGNGLKSEGIREITAATLTTSYQDIGGPTTHRAFIVTIMNDTNGDVYLRRTVDPVGLDTKRIAAQTGRIIDEKTNDAVELSGVQWQLKWAGTPPGVPAGNFWIEVEYV